MSPQCYECINPRVHANSICNVARLWAHGPYDSIVTRNTLLDGGRLALTVSRTRRAAEG